MKRRSGTAAMFAAMFIAMMVASVPSRAMVGPIKYWGPGDQLGEPGEPGGVGRAEPATQLDGVVIQVVWSALGAPIFAITVHTHAPMKANPRVTATR
jgi:hypothetical protein